MTKCLCSAYFIVLHHHKHGVSPHLIISNGEPEEEKVIAFLNEEEGFEEGEHYEIFKPLIKEI